MYRRIRDLREDSDLFQKDLAEYLQCSQVCYSHYEMGKRDIPTDVLIKLAEFYHEDVLDAHEIIDELERKVRKTLGVDLVIHHDPIVTDDEELRGIKRQVEGILHEIDDRLTVHDFRMVRGKKHTNVIFDLVLPFSMEPQKQALREAVERGLQKDAKQYHAVITFDHLSFNEPCG